LTADIGYSQVKADLHVRDVLSLKRLVFTACASWEPLRHGHVRYVVRAPTRKTARCKSKRAELKAESSSRLGPSMLPSQIPEAAQAVADSLPNSLPNSSGLALMGPRPGARADGRARRPPQERHRLRLKQQRSRARSVPAKGRYSFAARSAACPSAAFRSLRSSAPPSSSLGASADLPCRRRRGSASAAAFFADSEDASLT